MCPWKKLLKADPYCFPWFPFFFHNITNTSGSLSLLSSKVTPPRAPDLLLSGLAAAPVACCCSCGLLPGWHLGRALGHPPRTFLGFSLGFESLSCGSHVIFFLGLPLLGGAHLLVDSQERMVQRLVFFECQEVALFYPYNLVSVAGHGILGWKSCLEAFLLMCYDCWCYSLHHYDSSSWCFIGNVSLSGSFQGLSDPIFLLNLRALELFSGLPFIPFLPSLLSFPFYFFLKHSIWFLIHAYRVLSYWGYILEVFVCFLLFLCFFSSLSPLPLCFFLLAILYFMLGTFLKCLMILGFLFLFKEWILKSC